MYCMPSSVQFFRAASLPGHRRKTLPQRLTPAALALAAAFALSGCGHVSRPLDEPAPNLLKQWPAPQKQATHAAQIPWQQFYQGHELARLIQASLQHNQDLRIALLRIEEAQAAYRIQRADQLPTLAVGSSHARARVPGDLNPTRKPLTSGDQEVFVGMSSWEIDLWGRVRSLSEAALSNYLATEAAHSATQAMLIQQVARNYIALRGLDERIALTAQTIVTREQTLRMFTRRAEVGATSRYALTQVQTLLYQAQAIGKQLAQQRDLQAHALAQLTGESITTLQARDDDALLMSEVPAGLPSDLLVARPDIVAAEHALQAAKANVAAARAAFLPRVTLTGRFGTASAEFNGLFESGSRAWQFMPSISLPIFDSGRLQSNLDVQAVRQNIAVAQYEKSVESAMRDVLDAMSNISWLGEQSQVLAAQRDALKERSRLAKLRYDSGASPYLEVLDAERDLLSAEQQLAQTREAALTAQVALYAALGGGTATNNTTNTAATP